jgi:putative ABC transport system substrate-binding protein
MRRREFIALLGGTALAWPHSARAQQAGKVPKVGMVFPGPEAAAPTRVESVMNGLRAAGYDAPAQLELILRVTGGDPALINPLVAEVIASHVDVFLAFGLPIVLAVRSVSQTVPIVAVDLESDPVDSGLAASLAHPGGNVTGVYLAFPVRRQGF